MWFVCATQYWRLEIKDMNEIQKNKYIFLIHKSRHKWFSSTSRMADNGWFGPCDTMEQAIFECFSSDDYNDGICYVGQGHKLTKEEIEEMCVDYNWEVDTENAIEIRVPNLVNKNN